jgi:hypothetical protein
MLSVSVLVFNDKAYIPEVLNRSTGEEDGEAEKRKEKAKSSYVVRTTSPQLRKRPVVEGLSLLGYWIVCSTLVPLPSLNYLVVGLMM